MIRAAPRRRSSETIAVLGTLAVVSYGLLAIVQIAVLNPPAAVPGAGLNQIQGDMKAVGETMGGSWLLMAVGPVIAIAILLRVWRRPDPWPSRTASTYLMLLALGTPAYLFASFGPGMALADTYPISGGDHSPWAIPLYVASGLALMLLAAQLVWNSVRNRRADGVPRKSEESRQPLFGLPPELGPPEPHPDHM